MSAEEARRRNILPIDSDILNTSSLNQSPATRNFSASPPVAVVQGKQMTVQNSSKSSRYAIIVGKAV